MKYNVTEIEFDFDDGIKLDDSKLTFDEEIEVRDLALGVWEANDEDDLLDEITAATGWLIEKGHHRTGLVSLLQVNVSLLIESNYGVGYLQESK